MRRSALIAVTSLAAIPAYGQSPPPTSGIVRSVSTMPADYSGNVNFGCPMMPPISLGTNMAFNGVSSNCTIQTIGPMETSAQSAVDIASALTPYSTTTQMNSAISAASYSYVVGTPNTRSLSLATAYQATNTVKPAVVNVNLTSTATLSLLGGTTNSATVVIGSTNAVSSGTGTVICNYSNSNTGGLTIGLNIATVATSTCSFALPIGWYFAVRQTAGTVTITSAFDQSTG